MSYISNKQRLLKIVGYFDRFTDKDHGLAVEDIVRMLDDEYGYKAGTKGIKDDISTLLNNKFGLVENQNKYGKKYYSKIERRFETYELRLLIDAICSARFIKPSIAKKLINKIKTLTSDSEARKLHNEIYMDQTIVYDVPGLIYDIDKLHRALEESKTVKFKYGNYNVDKEFSLHHGGGDYFVEPKGLVWNNGFYYLVAKNIKKDEIINYRVDRMREVNIGNKIFDKTFFDLADHVKKCFNMYPGENSTVKMKFHNHLINAVVDRFGNKADIKVFDNKHFVLTFKAAVNKGLVRWILNWGADAEVLTPEELRQEVKLESEKMYKLYQ